MFHTKPASDFILAVVDAFRTVVRTEPYLDEDDSAWVSVSPAAYLRMCGSERWRAITMAKFRPHWTARGIFSGLVRTGPLSNHKNKMIWPNKNQ